MELFGGKVRRCGLVGGVVWSGFQKTGAISSELLVSCIELNGILICCYSTMPAGLNHGGDEIVCIPLEPCATL